LLQNIHQLDLTNPYCSGVFLGLIADFINHILTVGKSQSLRQPAIHLRS